MAKLRKIKDMEKAVDSIEAELKRLSKEAEQPLVEESLKKRNFKDRLLRRKLPVRPIKKKESLKALDKLKLKMYPEQSYLIEMFFSNGTCKTWVIRTKKETFTYKGRIYYLRYNNAWFNITRNQFKLFFNEDCSVPIDREIQLLSDPNNPKDRNIYWSVTPHNLRGLLKMEYIKKITESEGEAKIIKIILVITFINLLINIIRILGVVKR